MEPICRQSNLAPVTSYFKAVVEWFCPFLATLKVTRIKMCDRQATTLRDDMRKSEA